MHSVTVLSVFEKNVLRKCALMVVAVAIYSYLMWKFVLPKLLQHYYLHIHTDFLQYVVT